jgi:hypothetical protein
MSTATNAGVRILGTIDLLDTFECIGWGRYLFVGFNPPTLMMVASAHVHQKPYHEAHRRKHCP